jgi:hypothetical protein
MAQRNARNILSMSKSKYHEEIVCDLLEKIHRLFDEGPSKLQTIGIC